MAVKSQDKFCAGRLDAEACEACDVRDIVICNVLEHHELQRIAAIAVRFWVDPGATVITESDRADFLFNVTDGLVKVYKLLPDGRQQITGFLFPGDFLGIAMNDTYAYSADAVTRVRLCRFPRDRLESLLEDLPHLEKRLLGVASNELVQAQDQMLLLGRKSAEEKVCSFLLSLSRRAVRRGLDPAPIHLPMSRADMADYLGLTTETVSRAITKLKAGRVITLMKGGLVEIPSLDRLEEMASG